MKTCMIRARQTTAKELDETLVSLQNDGAQIWQIHPCPVNFKGSQQHTDSGQTNWGATVEMHFMVTYFEKTESPNAAGEPRLPDHDSNKGTKAAPGSVHELKAWPDLFAAVADGRKTFEVRKNDRGFKVGDTLTLREFRPCSRCHGSGREQLDAWDAAACSCGKPYGKYTGRKLNVRVTYITDFNQRYGYVVMAIAPNESSSPTAGGGSGGAQRKESK